MNSWPDIITSKSRNILNNSWTIPTYISSRTFRVIVVKIKITAEPYTTSKNPMNREQLGHASHVGTPGTRNSCQAPHSGTPGIRNSLVMHHIYTSMNSKNKAQMCQ
jgi:hypothetical protein